jgi:hypothetical protein
MTRSIPTLAEWFDRTDRGEGFEDYLRATLAMQAGKTDDERATLRMMQTFGVALVEMLRVEDRAGRGRYETLTLAPSVVGYSLFLSILSGMSPETPRELLVDEIARAVTAGIRHADAVQRREASQ